MAGAIFASAPCALGAAYFAFSGVNIIFPLWLQTTVGYTATWAGLAIAPVGLLSLIIAPIVGRNIARMNLRLAASFAFCVFGFAIFWTATLNETASFAQFAMPRLMQGVGIAFFFLPLNQILLSGVPANELASASGVSNFVAHHVRQLLDRHHRVGVESAQRLSSRRAHRAHPQLRRCMDALSGAACAPMGSTGSGASEYVNFIISSQASTLGVNDVFNMLGLLFLLLIPLVWFAKPPFGARAANPAH